MTTSASKLAMRSPKVPAFSSAPASSLNDEPMASHRGAPNTVRTVTTVNRVGLKVIGLGVIG
jgi:hypothetical protein